MLARARSLPLHGQVGGQKVEEDATDVATVKDSLSRPAHSPHFRRRT
jgi:hypothetical protein